MNDSNTATKNNAVGTTGFVFALLFLVCFAVAAFLAFGPFKVDRHWIDPLCIIGGVLGLLSCILGWCSFKTPRGKVAAIIGTIFVSLAFINLLWFSAAKPSHVEITPSVSAPQ